MVLAKDKASLRAVRHLNGARSRPVVTMENQAMNARTLTEQELAKVLQAHFRQFVRTARVTQDERTGEPVVRVEFADKPQ